MKLSPLDIQHQEFDSGMGGYKKQQVREFLTRVADTFEELLRDNQNLRDTLDEEKERVEELRVGELELRRAVVSAERIGNEMKERAQREASLIVQEAKSEKDVILRDAQRQLEETKAELARTEREHTLFREQFRGMLRAYERSLDQSTAKAPTSDADTSDAAPTPAQEQDQRSLGASVILEPSD